jgi:uncharacterized protein with GYD domain
MAKFLITFNYSSASWARMLAVSDDRASAVAELLEYLGGKLESMYWVVENAAAYVICDLPDSQSAAAAITACNKTGAFKDVQVCHLLDQDQVRAVVALAKNAEGVYQAPGAAAIEHT